MMRAAIVLFAILPAAAMAQTFGRVKSIISAAPPSGPSIVGTPVCGESAYGSAFSVSYTPYATGDTVYLGLWSKGTGDTYSGVTNNQSQTATLVSGAESATYAGIYSFPSIASGVTSLSATVSGSTYTNYCIAEFSSVSSTGATAQNAVTTTGSASPWAYTTNLTLANGGDYLYGVCVTTNSAASTPTATTGTLAGNAANTYGSNWGQYNTAASAGSVTIAGTVTGPSANLTLHCTLIDVE